MGLWGVYLEQAVKSFKKENYKLNAQNYILKEVLKQISNDKRTFFDQKSKENRKFIVNLIEDFKDIVPIKHLLGLLSISPSQYYRWKTEFHGCHFHTLKRCVIINANQLSLEEQETLIKYARSEYFKEYSTVSLMFYCKRNNILHCSLETWYKYLKLYGINRRPFKRKRKRYKKGIRANSVNEIWHIDITHIQYGDHQKAYLQLVVDNYSRMIIAWKVSHFKNMDLTYKTLMKSFHLVPDFQGSLMSDGGGENLGHRPKKLLAGRGIKQLVAKKEIHFSNSMIEAVFRQFKQKFLKRRPKNFKAVYQQVYKFVTKYNQKIPHTSLEGITPAEKFRGHICTKKLKVIFKQKMKEFRTSRTEKFRDCSQCRVKYLTASRLRW